MYVCAALDTLRSVSRSVSRVKGQGLYPVVGARMKDEASTQRLTMSSVVVVVCDGGGRRRGWVHVCELDDVMRGSTRPMSDGFVEVACLAWCGKHECWWWRERRGGVGWGGDLLLCVDVGCGTRGV